MTIFVTMGHYSLLVIMVTWSRLVLGDTDDLPTADDSPPVVGFVGKSVKLACGVDPSSVDGRVLQAAAGSPVVSWVDFVYNTDRDPQRIYWNDGKVGQLDKTHRNTLNYRVDPNDYSLTISNLKLEQDAGRYICRRVIGGTTQYRSYYLNVGDVPKCSGTTALRPGAATKLSCEAQYSGELQPILTWVRDGIEIDSNDEFDILLAARSVTVAAVTDQDDDVEYTCHMNFGSVVEQCRLQLDVTYLARDIVLAPQKSSLRVGEELRCSARGNPTPEITLTAQSPATDVRHGKGWRSMIVPDEWWKNEVAVTCTATNTIDGATEILTQTAVYNITEKEQNLLSKGAIVSNNTSIIAVIAGIVITLVITFAIVAIVIVRRRNKDSKKPLKGAKPVPTKEEVTLDPNGQAV